MNAWQKQVGRHGFESPAPREEELRARMGCTTPTCGRAGASSCRSSPAAKGLLTQGGASVRVKGVVSLVDLHCRQVKRAALRGGVVGAPNGSVRDALACGMGVAAE